MTWSGYLEKVSIKQPVLSFFSNSRSLEQPGLMIETLEYRVGVYLQEEEMFGSIFNRGLEFPGADA